MVTCNATYTQTLFSSSRGKGYLWEGNIVLYDLPTACVREFLLKLLSLVDKFGRSIALSVKPFSLKPLMRLINLLIRSRQIFERSSLLRKGSSD
jgi:hypothetical protein